MGYRTGRAVWALLMLVWWLFTGVSTGALADGDGYRLLGQTVIVGVVWLLVDVLLRRTQRQKEAAKSDAGRSMPLSPMPRTPLVQEYKGPLAFFRRHFNGDYSLARSYWVNTFLVSLFAPVLGLILLPLLNENFPARYGSAGFLLITALAFVVWVWAISGTWASANKHVQRGGTAFWAGAAKVVIVFGAIKAFGDFVQSMPVFQEHMKVAVGEQPGNPTKLEIRADGKSILLAGGINDGSADQLERALQMAPSVSTVVLASDGGWIREGEMLADVIRHRGLNTYVEGRCASACTIAFLAGKERVSAPSARLGFHASRSVGNVDAETSPIETARIVAIYREAGLPENFIRKAVSTPSGELWFPSHQELLTAGVLTRQSLGGETAAMATALRSKEALVAALRADGGFDALATRWPQDFQQIVDTVWGTMQAGATDAEVITAARPALLAILPRFLGMASDETLVSYQELLGEQLEAMRELDPRACAEMVFPSGQPMRLISRMPPALAKRELELMKRMLLEADEARQVAPRQSVLEEVGQRVMGRMTQEQLAIFADESFRQKSSPQKVCDAAIAFNAGLGAIPVVQRGRAVRVLLQAAN